MSLISKIKDNWNTENPFKSKVSDMLQTDNSKQSAVVNPFLDKNGNLFNPYINYQKALDSNSTTAKVKEFISQATGLSSSLSTVNNVSALPENVGSTTTNSIQNSDSAYAPDGNYKNSVGKRITDTSKYNNSAAKGQCVWYALGRASERNGKNISISGNGNSMYYNAKSEAKTAPTPENLKGNMLLCYDKGTSNAGQKYGHVIFIEDVVGDTVYYTEGGSGYYKNGTDGVVKTASKSQILNGVNSNGAKIGSNPVGLVDLSKY